MTVMRTLITTNMVYGQSNSNLFQGAQGYSMVIDGKPSYIVSQDMMNAYIKSSGK